jgi:hypothetical protein
LLIVSVPSVVLPSRNVTVPVAAGGVTVTVNVVDEPNATGFAEEVNETVVLDLITVCVSAGEVLAVSFVSPP